MLTPQQRRRFDRLFDAVLDELPEHLLEMLEEVPVIIEDEPSRRLLREMEIDDDEDLCGLHSGIPLTQKSVERSGDMPSQIMLFRGPIMRQAGPGHEALEQQIRITLHHEIGHQFGLDEDDLEALGYG